MCLILVCRWCCATFGGVVLAMEMESGCTTIAAVETSGLTSGDEFSPTTKLQIHFVSTHGVEIVVRKLNFSNAKKTIVSMFVGWIFEKTTNTLVFKSGWNIRFLPRFLSLVKTNSVDAHIEADIRTLVTLSSLWFRNFLFHDNCDSNESDETRDEFFSYW